MDNFEEQTEQEDKGSLIEGKREPVASDPGADMERWIAFNCPDD